RGDEGQRNAGIARSRLDDGSARLQRAVLFERVDHGDADTVLDAGDGIEEFELGEKVRLDPALLADAVETHERRVADRLRDRIVDTPTPPELGLLRRPRGELGHIKTSSKNPCNEELHKVFAELISSAWRKLATGARNVRC